MNFDGVFCRLLRADLSDNLRFEYTYRSIVAHLMLFVNSFTIRSMAERNWGLGVRSTECGVAWRGGLF